VVLTKVKGLLNDEHGILNIEYWNKPNSVFNIPCSLFNIHGRFYKIKAPIDIGAAFYIMHMRKKTIFWFQRCHWKCLLQKILGWVALMKC